MFHIGKGRVDLDSFAAFLTQPDTAAFAHDGITIDTTAPFTLDSWLFTHQISWAFPPLALRLALHNARFEFTLALRQEVPKPSDFRVTPDLFHWQGHLLDGIRVTLSFGVNCLELASDSSDSFIYVRFPYPEPGHPPQLEHKGWTLTPDCGSYFFSRASHSLGHIRPGVVDASDPPRPASLLKWPATSLLLGVGTPASLCMTPTSSSEIPARRLYPILPHGYGPTLSTSCFARPELVPSTWLASFAALTGITLTQEHNALLQHPLIPSQFSSRVIAPLRDGDIDKVKDYVTEILSCTGPSWQIKKGR